MQPSDLEQLARSGVAALDRGDAAAARQAFEAVVAAGRATPQLWLLLAQARAGLGDAAAAHGALDQVLAVDRGNLWALTMKGDLLQSAGDDRAAGAWYQAALDQAARLGAQPPEMAARLERARDAIGAAGRRYEAHLRATLAAAGVDGAGLPHFDEAIAIMAGAKPVQLQRPTSFYYPALPNIAFYDTGGIDWIARLEAAAPAMRAEAEAVLADPDGVSPYVERQADRPAKAHPLLDDRRWSAFHLWREGRPVEAALAHCPATMAALAAAPVPRIAGRSPMALFSILRPGTHIPPHHGMLNTRLICHIPLIVPDGCRLRVGNHIRPVEAGKALLFDDSMEHEAWNDGASTRVILLFEVWRPELSEAERRALTAMFEAIGTYPGGEG